MHNIEKLSFLKKYLDEQGKIDYNKLKNDEILRTKIIDIEQKNLNKFSSNKEELVFWLNAYNLLVLKGVLGKLDKNPDWKGTKGYISRIKFFYLKKFNIGKKRFSLYEIENSILRKKFKDPRIHFAINCASTSCPILPTSLFSIETVDELLNQYTKSFINGINVVIKEEENLIILNPIFKWYRKDFEEKGGILSFIEKYHQNFPLNLNEPKIIYSNYDWTLNKQ